MRRLKNYLRSTMTTGGMTGLALMHAHKDTELDAERIIHQFSRQKNRRLVLLVRPEWRRQLITEPMLKQYRLLNIPHRAVS